MKAVVLLLACFVATAVAQCDPLPARCTPSASPTSWPPICTDLNYPNPSGSAQPCCPQVPNCRLSPDLQCWNGTISRFEECKRRLVAAGLIRGCPVGTLAMRRTERGDECCPTCNPYEIVYPVCTAAPETIPLCANGVLPVRQNSGCPSCRPPGGSSVPSVCTATVLNLCFSAEAIEAMTPCDPGRFPERGTPGATDLQGLCCPSCKPLWVKNCNDTSVRACIANSASLPDCAAGAESQFNPENCCRTCKRPLPPPSERPDSTGRCTIDNIRLCRRNSPVCRDGELPTRRPEFCCPSCRRPEEDCRPEEVAACTARQPPCDNIRPQHVTGDCCLSCRPRRKPCNPQGTPPGCPRGQICHYRRSGPNSPALLPDGVCVPRRFVKFVVATTVASRVNAINCANVVHTIREIVFRYCAQTQNRLRCARWMSHLESLNVRDDECTEDTTRGELTVTVETPEGPVDASGTDPNAVIVPGSGGAAIGETTPASVEHIQSAFASKTQQLDDMHLFGLRLMSALATDADSSSGVTSSAATDGDAGSGFAVTVAGSSDGNGASTIAPAHALAAISIMTLLALL